MAHRIERERFEGVDLLGDAHRAQLGGDVGAHTAGEGEPREHRREFERDRLLHEGAYEVRRHDVAHAVAGQQREHDAGEQGDEDADGE